MKEALEKLLKVKSIVTIILTILVAYLAVARILDADKVFEAYLIIIGFYFGTQKIKETEDDGND